MYSGAINFRTAGVGIQRIELRAQRPQHRVRQLANCPQWIILAKSRRSLSFKGLKVEFAEMWTYQPQQRPEAVFDTTVWCGTEEKQVAIRVQSNLLYQFVALLLVSRSLITRVCGSMNLINDDQIRTMLQQECFSPVTLCKVDANDQIRIVLVEGDPTSGY